MPGQDTINAIAGGTIRPWRAVNVSTAADNTLLEADAGEYVCGICDGSTKDDTNANHAESGDQVSLQPGSIMKAEAGAAITRGALLESNADGELITRTTGIVVGVALESAADANEVIRIWFQPHLV